MHGLDRLVQLAQKTGDRLIIHDRQADADMVMMNVDEYEALVTSHMPVESLSQEELIEKMNEDIAIWRSNKANKESGRLEERIIHNMISLAGDEQEHLHQREVSEAAESWHRIGDVMKEHFPVEHTSVELEEDAKEEHLEYQIVESAQQEPQEDVDEAEGLRYEVPVEEEEEDAAWAERNLARFASPMGKNAEHQAPEDSQAEKEERKPIPKKEVSEDQTFTEGEGPDAPVFLDEPL